MLQYHGAFQGAIVKLYHGSSVIVEKPVFGAGKATNDYGRGFYCTENLDLAREWACPRRNDGFVNKYELPTSGLKVLDLNGPGMGVMEWLYVLITNRPVRLASPIQEEGMEWIRSKFAVEADGYDIIRGYRADDSYFGFVRAFLENGITVGQLSRAMRLGNLGEQIMVKSEKAFSALRFTGYEIVPWTIYNARRLERDEAARADFRKESSERPSEGVYLIDIIREGMERGDARLR